MRTNTLSVVILSSVLAVGGLVGCNEKTEGERTLDSSVKMADAGNMITRGEKMVQDGSAMEAKGKTLKEQGNAMEGDRMINEGQAMEGQGNALIAQGRKAKAAS